MADFGHCDLLIAKILLPMLIGQLIFVRAAGDSSFSKSAK
jgi:hypothetical protein